MKNPFELLGITPEICRALKDEELFALVKSNYKILQTIYHPDKGGTHRKATQINLAFEILNYKKNPDTFTQHKEKYIKKIYMRSRTRAKELEEQLQYEEKKFRQTVKKYYEYIIHQLRCGKLDDGIGLKGVTMGLYDVVLQKNIPDSTRIYSTNYKKIRVDERGRIFVKEVGSSSFHERRFTKFLGTIPKDAIDVFPHLYGYETSPHVPFNLRRGAKLLNYKKPVFKNVFLQENFIIYCLPHLVPFIKENNYLISFNANKEKVILDGCIIKITPYSST